MEEKQPEKKVIDKKNILCLFCGEYLSHLNLDSCWDKVTRTDFCQYWAEFGKKEIMSHRVWLKITQSLA